jgi:hypothetical protein
LGGPSPLQIKILVEAWHIKKPTSEYIKADINDSPSFLDRAIKGYGTLDISRAVVV